MPIKPENKARYPKEWKAIRARILKRAGDCCANTGEHFGQTHMSSYECNGRWINIVLTIAHLDHTPENCDDDNLRALCQRCHLKHDREHHAETAKATRRARLQTPELF